MKSTFFLSLIFLTGIWAETIRIKTYKDIIIQSNLPNKGKSYFVSPCSFTASPVKNEPIYIRITKTIPYEYGCLRRGNANGAYHCILDGEEDSLENFCNGNVWKMTANSASILTLIESNAWDPTVPTSFEVQLYSSQTTSPFTLDVKVYMNTTGLYQTWFPLVGSYGGGFMKTQCSKGSYVTSMEAFRRVWDNIEMFSGLKMTCSDGIKYAASEGTDAETASTLVDCSDDSSYPVNGVTASFLRNRILYPSPIGLRFSCGKNYKSEWIGYPEESSLISYSLSYTCPGGSVLNGLNIYSGYIIDGFGVNCEYVPIEVDTTVIKSSYLVGTTNVILPIGFIKLSLPNSGMPKESLSTLQISISLDNVDRAKYQIQTFNGIYWIPIQNYTVSYSDILTNSVQVSFDKEFLASNTMSNNNLKFFMSLIIMSDLGHKIPKNSIPFEIMQVTTDFQVTNIEPIIFNSTLPNTGSNMEFIYSPCSFKEIPFRYEDVFVKLSSNLPSDLGCLTKVNSKGAFICVDTIADGVDLRSFCNPAIWRIIPNSFALLPSGDSEKDEDGREGQGRSGSTKDIDSSFSLQLSTNIGSKPISVTAPVKFHIAKSHNSWFPVLGMIQGKYHKVLCPFGSFVVKITTQFALFDGASMFTGMFVYCSGGEKFSLVSNTPNNNLGITATPIDCTDDSSESEYVDYVAIYTGATHSSPIGLKFGCSNTPKSSWTGVADGKDNIYQKCPFKNAATGVIAYSSDVLHGISLVCGVSDKKQTQEPNLSSKTATFRERSSHGTDPVDPQNGSGVGVAIVLVLVAVAASGGFIWYQRRKGRGFMKLNQSVEHLVQGRKEAIEVRPMQTEAPKKPTES